MKSLIVDSGSTKTRWRLTDGEGTVVTTVGLNPLLTPEADFRAAVRQMLGELPEAADSMDVWFYGAGCGTEEMTSRVASWLGKELPNATVHVAGDLLGACRAACGHAAGLVGILGTGSNLCHYDGETIDRQCFSTGYLLGDEGSGNHIGRRLLKDYLEGSMPDEVTAWFHEENAMTHEEFLHHLYQRSYPNRFLASLAPFASRHRETPYVAQVLNECFNAFMLQVERHHLPKEEPLHLVGGLAASFAKEMGKAAELNGLHLVSLTPDPLERLVRFHSNPANERNSQ